MSKREADGCQAGMNTDVEIWRKSGNDPTDTDNFYQPSIRITKGQGVMICKGGTCYTKPIEEWIKLATEPPEEWVSVEERLPESEGRYFCYVTNGREEDMAHKVFNLEKKRFSLRWEERVLDMTVTHWRPLPPKPTSPDNKTKG